jgi:hypothetical protein
MYFSPISQERAVVVVSTDPNNISTKRLLAYELEDLQVFPRQIRIRAVDNVTVENKIASFR